MSDTTPTMEEAEGLTWWNGLNETGQAYWMQIAKACTSSTAASAAWEVAKRVTARAAVAPQ